MKVVFRADSGRTVGIGHIMRCLTLADELRRSGADVRFISREHPGHDCGLIEARGYPVHRLPPGIEPGRDPSSWLGVSPSEDARETIEALDARRPDWLVVDHYALDEAWETRLRPHVGHLLAIDDLADRRHDVDLLLDQNRLDDDDSAYEQLVPAGARVLLGPRFALLRSEFVEARRREPRPIGETVERVFVFLGGNDPDDVTSTVLRALVAGRFAGQVDVVVGPSNPNVEKVEALASQLPAATVHRGTNRIASLMAEADVAIGAAGTASWERLCLGLPSIVVQVADNQQVIAEGVGRAGGHLTLGPHTAVSEDDWRRAIALLHNQALRHCMRDAGRALVDGLGAGRVARAMAAFLPVVAREAVAADCDVMHAWRNAETVRRVSLDSSEIPLDAHRAWFQRVLNDPDRHLLVGELDGEGVGVVRWDLDREKQTAEVSIYVSPSRLGQGLGPALLRAGERWLRANEPAIHSVRALVRPQNRASRTLFAQDGYEADHLTFIKRLQKED